MRRSVPGISVVLLVCVALTRLAGPACGDEADGPTRLELTGAEHYVEEFEKYADRMKGRPFDPKRYGAPAMKRVKSLYERFPDHPKIQELYERVRTVVKKSKGDFIEITPEMLAYRKQEADLVEKLGALAAKAWDAYLARFAGTGRLLETPFPAPEPGLAASEDDMYMRKVVLEGFAYPANEFTNTGRQYVAVGSSTRGFYFVSLSNRRWLGAYEALRRYRGAVKDDLPTDWTVTGTVVGSNLLVPHSGERVASDVARFGWIVEPEAIYVEGHVLARALPGDERGGTFAGEERLEELKRPYLTYTEVPDDVEPRKLVEIFATAIKEKNYELFLDCIDPARKKGPKSIGRLRYFWENNLHRFATYYVHVDPFEVGDIVVLKGERFDDGDIEDFFLTEEDKEDAASRADDLLEEVAVRIRTFDEKGKQVSLPKDVILRRTNGGRWYVYEGYPL